MARRRVLFVSNWSTAHGGSSVALIQIVARIDRERFDPVVLCPEPGDLPDRMAELNVPVHIRRNARLSKNSLLSFIQDTASYFYWLKRERIDIIHCHSGGWRRSVLLSARLRSIPFIKHLQNPFRGTARDFGFRWAKRIVACSDAIADALRKDSRLQDKAVTVHNAVDLTEYHLSDDENVQSPVNDRPTIGFVGQIDQRKGVYTLIESLQIVLREVPKAQLVVVGAAPKGSEDYMQECSGLVESLGLQSRVTFTGYRRDVPALMRSFNVFVLPTRSEGLVKVVLEAMAAGCPVVTTNITGMDEIIDRPDVGTLVPPDDAQATAAAIIRFLTDRELAERVGKCGAQHVRQRFGLEDMVRQMESVYDEVLAEA